MNRRGSICAIICPGLTTELKSAPSAWIVPDTCAPTWTVTIGLTVPVAVTLARIGPRSTVVVSNRNAGAFLAAVRLRARKPMPAIAATTTSAAAIFQDLLMARCEPLRIVLTVAAAVVIVRRVYAASVPQPITSATSRSCATTTMTAQVTRQALREWLARTQYIRAVATACRA